MNSDQLTALATAAAVVVAVIAAAIAGLAGRAQRLDFLTTIRAQWEELADDWASAILLHAGDPNWHYSPASVKERRRISKVMEKVRSEDDLGERVAALRAETKSVRRVARFLAYAADSVLRGRITLRDAYAVFGPDVSRQREFVLWASGRTSLRDLHGDADDEWFQLIDQVPENHFYDEQDAIVMLADLLSSESSRRGDTYPHLVAAAAAQARPSFSAGVSRRTLWRLVRLRSAPWTYAWLLPKLRRLTHPPRDAARRPDATLIADDHVMLFRRGLRSRSRADRTLRQQKHFDN